MGERGRDGLSPLVVGNRTTEYLDRIWDNFYVYIGSVLAT
jgi:hypothetical protein